MAKDKPKPIPSATERGFAIAVAALAKIALSECGCYGDCTCGYQHKYTAEEAIQQIKELIDGNR